MIKTLETDRLYLTKFTPQDTDFIIRLVNSPGWLEYIGQRNVHNEEQALEYMHRMYFSKYEEGLPSFEKVVLTATDEPVGMCGIIKRDSLDFPDIGYAFLPEYHGKGYAKEIANAVLHLFTKVYSMSKVIAITTKDNAKSIALLHSLGFNFEGYTTWPGEALELNVFGINIISH
jgi:RimJ/RimL family protein N-acetyltransferase